MMDDVGELASGTVTFLLTDIEGSSRLWEERPEHARAVTRRCRELIMEASVAHGGACPIEHPTR